MKAESLRRKAQKALYYLNNRDKILKQTTEYQKKNRPTVYAYRQKWRTSRRLKNLKPKKELGSYNQDSLAIKRFGGLREIVIQRDQEKCLGCSLTRQEHWNLYGCDITVNHINGLGRYSEAPDNRLENLETLCLRCHGLKDVKRMVRK